MSQYRIRKIPNSGFRIEKYLEEKTGFIFKKLKKKWHPLANNGKIWYGFDCPLPLAYYDSLEEAQHALTEIKQGWRVMSDETEEKEIMITTHAYTGKKVAGINVNDIASFIIHQIETKQEQIGYNHTEEIVDRSIEWRITFRKRGSDDLFVSQMNNSEYKQFLENLSKYDFLVWDETNTVLNRRDF